MTEDQIAPPIVYHRDFLSPSEHDEWFRRSRDLSWERGEITMYGKPIPVPREEALYGDDLRYQYRGHTVRALPWPDFLLEARDRIRELSGFTLNFAVGNRYLTGRDSIGWHSDDFPQIGERPPVVSLSLGGTRRFKLKHRETGQTVDLDLAGGSLLIMLPGCQQEWLHAVPKTKRDVGERINWTFRPHVEAGSRASANVDDANVVGPKHRHDDVPRTSEDRAIA